jgi:NAD(P)H-dependent FMN reductase
MTRIGIVVGSTRPGRKAAAVAQWVLGIAQRRTDAEFEVVDLADYHLPLLDEPIPPSVGKYAGVHTKSWADKIGTFDGFVFVTPEYNHSTSAALKNALDFVYGEWNNKAAGFVGYGSAGGVRAVEHLRGIAAELQIATVRAQVMLSLATDFENYTTFRPDPSKEKTVERTIAQVVSWSRALEAVRKDPPPD